MRVIFILIEMLSGPRTPQPNRTTHVEEDKWDRHEQNSEETEQTGRPLPSQSIVHLGSEQGEASADEVSRQNDTRQRGGRVGLVTVHNVVQNTEDHDVDARAEKGGRNDGNDPVHRGIAGPAEPEQTDRDEDSP